jgi:predicted enzyme related to lactoylglutathione lyase
MIRGLHGMFYSSAAEATRDFLRDTLALPFTDVGRGWLLFDLPLSDVGVHPTDGSNGPPAGTHDVSFFCDDIHGTVATLKQRGVAFTDGIVDQGYGFVTYFQMPGGIEVQLYEPKYVKRSDAPTARKRAAAAKPKRSTRSKTAKRATPERQVAKRKPAKKAARRRR